MENVQKWKMEKLSRWFLIQDTFRPSSASMGRDQVVVTAAAVHSLAVGSRRRLTFEFIVRLDLMDADAVAVAAAAALVDVVSAVEPWDPTLLVLLAS